MNGGGYDFHAWKAGRHSLRASAEKAIRRFLPTGNGLEIYGFNDKIEKHVLAAPGSQVPGMEHGSAAAEFSREPGQVKGDGSPDFVCISCVDMQLAQLSRLIRYAFEILKPNGIVVLAFLDPDSEMAEKYFNDLQQSGTRAEEVLFELSHCGFSHFEFLQTVCSPHGQHDAEDPRPGYGEGLVVVVRARKRI